MKKIATFLFLGFISLPLAARANEVQSYVLHSVDHPAPNDNYAAPAAPANPAPQNTYQQPTAPQNNVTGYYLNNNVNPSASENTAPSYAAPSYTYHDNTVANAAPSHSYSGGNAPSYSYGH